MKLTSNAGGTNQLCSFTFNKNKTVGKIVYEVNRKIYNYDFVYNGDQLASINIADKPKISFGYDKYGRLKTITREIQDRIFEYKLEYISGKNRANIKLFVVQGKNRRPSPEDYFVTWNSELKLESYCIDIYCSKDLKYTSRGDLLSYAFDNDDEYPVIVQWEYSAFDKKRNWVERKYKDIVFNRDIEYK
jgi:hypothetical protein